MHTQPYHVRHGVGIAVGGLGLSKESFFNVKTEDLCHGLLRRLMHILYYPSLDVVFSCDPTMLIIVSSRSLQAVLIALSCFYVCSQLLFVLC